MAEPIRKQKTNRGQEPENKRGQTLKPGASRSIGTLVQRTRASELEQVLRLRLATFEDLPQAEEGPEDPEETAEEDDPFDSMDVEDGDADVEGDFTEEDESFLPLDGIGLEVPQERDWRADVVVERIACGDTIRFVVRSGISDLLLRMSGGDPVTRSYHDGLRQRIADTLRLGQEIVQENPGFFAQQAARKKRLPRDEVRKKLGIEEERFSRLLSSMALQTPWGARVEVQDFFVDRSVSEVSDEALLQVFIEHLEKDRLEPLKDGQLVDYVNLIMQGRAQKSLKRVGVQRVRQRLGIPEQVERRRGYKENREFLDLVVLGDDPVGRWQKWERLLERLLPNLRNERAQQTVQAWLGKIEERLSQE